MNLKPVIIKCKHFNLNHLMENKITQLIQDRLITEIEKQIDRTLYHQLDKKLWDVIWVKIDSTIQNDMMDAIKAEMNHV